MRIITITDHFAARDLFFGSCKPTEVNAQVITLKTRDLLLKTLK